MNTSHQRPAIILGIDPGTVITGFALLLCSERGPEPIDFGCIRPKASLCLSDRYLQLAEALDALIARHRPTVCALETQFVAKNPQSALKVGMARGIALLGAKRAGMRTFGYTPMEIKRAVVGNGRASKEQVIGMTAALFCLDPAKLTSDAADALACALCHAHRLKATHSLNKAEI